MPEALFPPLADGAITCPGAGSVILEIKDTGIGMTAGQVTAIAILESRLQGYADRDKAKA